MMKFASRFGAALLLLVAVSASAAAADPAPPYGGYIESAGTATVDAYPDNIEFWLQRTAEGNAAAEAIYAASQLESQLAAQLKTTELPTPTASDVSEVSFLDANKPSAKSTAHLVFSARAYANPKTGLTDFGALCDGMVAFAQSLNCKLEGPSFSSEAKNDLEQTAVARAVEQALNGALGAARVMKTRIDSVDTVTVEDIAWNKDPESRAAQPQVRRVTCTAKVRVRYLFSSAP
jgi:uncharacterized protein YggE